MASSHIVPMWKRNNYGKLDIRHANGDQVEQAKLEGWYDSPDKVPPALPGTVVEIVTPPPVNPPKHQGPFGSVHGEGADEAKRSVRAKTAPRVNGRFVKARA